jgi:type 1 glutamine amidotransferase
LTYAAKKTNLKNVKVLVYTKNGKGYVHDNIPSAVIALQKLGVENKFKVDVSDDPAVFTEDNLKQYTMLIFPSTNNDVFDTDQQRLAFRRYIQAGGGFVGIHSVTGTERNWRWFKQLIGGTFSWHARNQTFSAQIIKPEHPSLQGLPKIWSRKDECYFTKELYPGIEVIMAHDISSLNPNEEEKIKNFSAPFGNLYPAVWHQNFDGGNMWLTTFGHDKESYEEPVYLQHILQGIKYIASLSKKLDYSKAYAVSKDDPVRY